MKKIISLLFSLIIIGVSLLTFIPVNANLIQQPTIGIPTVTGTPKGVTATIGLDQEEPINVRSGPSVFFDKIGVLLPGQELPVLGKTAGGDWILIEYLGVPGNIGWIYAPYVVLTPGEIQIVEPPPTPSPIMTKTINPTLAAQFIVTPISTRLPTFTPAPPMIIPTYMDYSISAAPGGIPMGLIILVIAGLGVLIALFSKIREM